MPFIAVLEDDSRRIAAIRSTATDALADCEVRMFSDARKMVLWLKSNVARCHLISLDCDLDSVAVEGEDCGSGEDVTAFLATNMPTCPVIIHSSNVARAPAMHMELAMAGCSRVLLRPFRDAEQWTADVREALLLE